MDAALLHHRRQSRWKPQRQPFGSQCPETDDFWFRVERLQVDLSQSAALYPTVLIAESDPIQFLAAFVAAVCQGCPVVLGNPGWRAAEWQAVLAQVHPDYCVGTVPEVAPRLQKDVARPQPGWILIPTGGSSGQIRFVIHTWDRLMVATQGFHEYFLGSLKAGWQPIHCCCVLPLYHVSGLMQFVRSFVSGGQLAIAPFTEIMTHHIPVIEPQISFLSLVPTQLHRLLSEVTLQNWLCQFQTVFLGGGPAWGALLQTARQQGIRLAPTYGMTETAAQVATLKPEDFLAGHNHCGTPLPHVQLYIQDDQGQPLETDQVGRIAIGSAALCQGYYPAFAPPPSIWVTDDRGFLSATGALQVVGRSSRKIISGGENIYPEEIEAALYATGWVQDVYVMGLPDPDWGEVVTAFYVPLDPTLTSTQLATALQDHLSRYKHPKRWIPLTMIPRNAQGKLSRLDRLLALTNL
ncbi:AMP-binding protein [Synechococcales cyanobacterium C]|uniref:AMP-binding protein n=1 Tax=Petrachloros mirabilis ULC683 TaxID=2781853 RepID=A0A8K1ZYG6_9CYAN|nr:2-succinylbenzoate--CoA ligase [Petrachloros mirabilis]NCJ05962.1 AMP-binding protein [Petrachloros mirabilis ULC683]